MYKKFISIIICSLIMTSVFAQGPSNPPRAKVSKQQFHKQMFEKKRLYFIEKMELTETESAAFTTLFTKYNEDIRSSHIRVFRASQKCETEKSEESYKNFIDVITTEKKYQGDREAEFIKSLKNIMSAEKVFKYCDAERDFKMLMMKEVQPAPKQAK